MDKEVMIRTDIIDPLLYAKIKLYYEDTIKTIDKLYGYIQYKDFHTLFKKGVEKNGVRLIRNMEKDGVLKSIRLNNSKYIKLEGAAIKYLKETRNVSFFADRPGTKLLSRSFYAAWFYIQYEKFLITVKEYLKTKGRGDVSIKSNLYFSGRSDAVNFVMFDYDYSKLTYLNTFFLLDCTFKMPYTLSILARSTQRREKLEMMIKKILSNNNLVLNGKKEGERAFALNMETGLQRTAIVNADIEKYFKLNTVVDEQQLKKKEVDNM